MCRNRVVCACVLLLSAAGLSAPAGAQPPNPELTRILDLMEARQKQAGIVRIKAEGTRLVPKGAETAFYGPALSMREPGKLRPPEDQITTVKEDFTFDYRTPRWRMQRYEKTGTEVESWVKTFDGKKLFSVSGEGRDLSALADYQPTSLTTLVGVEKLENFVAVWWPYFVSQGYILSSHRRPYHWGDYAHVIDREELYLHGTNTVEGIPCAVLRQFPYGPKDSCRYCEYFVARADGAVQRMTEWHEKTSADSGKRTTTKGVEISIEYDRRNGQARPIAWTSNLWFYHENVYKFRHNYKLKVRAEDVPLAPPEVFQISPAADARIVERQYASSADAMREGQSKTSHFTVDQSGEWVPTAADGMRLSSFRYPFLWAVSLGCLVLCVILWRFYRKQRSPQSGGAS
jgi:hypothetical protein